MTQNFLLGLRQLGLYKKIFVLLIVIGAVAFVIVDTNAWNLLGKPINLGITEEAVVRKVSFDSTNDNILLLDVQSMCSKTIVFNTAVIKNSQQTTVATIVSFQNDLPAYKNATIKVDLSGIILSPGNYTIDLWTTRSHYFSSPPFVIQ
jgi:hypothetical protein